MDGELGQRSYWFYRGMVWAWDSVSAEAWSRDRPTVKKEIFYGDGGDDGDMVSENHTVDLGGRPLTEVRLTLLEKEETEKAFLLCLF